MICFIVYCVLNAEAVPDAKVGECPSGVSISQAQCPELQRCSSEHDCNGLELCCESSACGKVCMFPESLTGIWTQIFSRQMDVL